MGSHGSYEVKYGYSNSDSVSCLKLYYKYLDVVYITVIYMAQRSSWEFYHILLQTKATQVKEKLKSSHRQANADG